MIRVKDFRRLFGSHLLNQEDVDPLLVANLMGHSSVGMLLNEHRSINVEQKQNAKKPADPVKNKNYFSQGPQAQKTRREKGER